MYLFENYCHPDTAECLILKWYVAEGIPGLRFLERRPSELEYSWIIIIILN